MLSKVVLPLPDGPSSTTTSFSAIVEIDVVEGMHLHLARDVGLGQVTRCEDGLGHGMHR
jgi:hypothetical protein